MSEAAPGGLPLRPFADSRALASTAAELIADGLREAIARSGQARLAVAGGTTPADTYRRLSSLALDWPNVTIVPTDERWVEPSSPDSNQRFLHETLLQGPAAAARFIPLWSDAATPEAAAARAASQVAAVDPFDVVVLGMGEDGHFASLFPGSPVLAEGLDLSGASLCIGVPAGDPAPPQPRISLTFRAFQHVERILLLITGDTKRRVLEDAWLGDRDLPVGSLRGLDQGAVQILWSP